MIRAVLRGPCPLWSELRNEEDRELLSRELGEMLGALDVVVTADEVHPVVAEAWGLPGRPVMCAINLGQLFALPLFMALYLRFEAGSSWAVAMASLGVARPWVITFMAVVAGDQTMVISGRFGMGMPTSTCLATASCTPFRIVASNAACSARSSPVSGSLRCWPSSPCATWSTRSCSASC